jgi:carbonic anhydrase/acetyltransferase-like protein (isoleucine patch superfamily)
MTFSGKVSVGSNSNILEGSVVTAFEASAVSIGSNVVVEQVACCSQNGG